LRLADAAVYRQVDAAADDLAGALGQELDRAGVPHRVQRAGSLFSVFFGEAPATAPVTNYQAALGQDQAMFRAFFHHMAAQGVLLPPSPFEAWFLSAAHTPDILQHLTTAIHHAATQIPVP
jgi:glutamate-1-semialdehyde 2,1-aminomutase